MIPSEIPRRGATSIDLIIENNSDMVLYILVGGKQVGGTSPGESIIGSGLPNPFLPESKEISYHVVANNTHGQKVFGEILELSELEIIDYETLKMAIEPFYKEITFQNKTSSVVTVFVNFYRVGEIEPGETIKKNVPIYSELVLVKAEGAQGKTVYYSTQNNVSWEFRDKKWEEVITPFGD